MGITSSLRRGDATFVTWLLCETTSSVPFIRRATQIRTAVTSPPFATPPYARDDDGGLCGPFHILELQFFRFLCHGCNYLRLNMVLPLCYDHPLPAAIDGVGETLQPVTLRAILFGNLQIAIRYPFQRPQ